MFIAFAGFLLVKRYQTPYRRCCRCGWRRSASPGPSRRWWAGRSTASARGKVPTLHFSCLTAFFVGHGLVHSVPVAMKVPPLARARKSAAPATADAAIGPLE